MKTRALVGILISGLLVFGLMSTIILAGDWALEENTQKSEEETLNKIAQDLWLAIKSVELADEENAVSETIVRLEIFQTDDLVLQNKIRNDWLPFLREYLGILRNLHLVVEKFGKRGDFIPYEKILAELMKVYPENTSARVKQVAEEMNMAGIFEKLFK